MLSIFPDLFWLSFLAPLLLRLALGGAFFGHGVIEFFRPQQFKSKKISRAFGLFNTLLGLFLLIGFLTQLVCFVIILELICCLFLRLRHKNKISAPADYLIVLIIIAFSLIVLGAGPWAVDWPL